MILVATKVAMYLALSWKSRVGFSPDAGAAGAQGGVDLSMYETRSDNGLAEKKKRLYAANELAATYYQRQLIKDSSAIHYVSNVRGLNRQVVLDFRLGYAPEQGSSLSRFMLDKKFTPVNSATPGWSTAVVLTCCGGGWRYR